MAWIERLLNYFGFERKSLVYTVSFNSDSSATATFTVSFPTEFTVEEVLSWRKRLGWTRAQLAKRAGLSISTIGRIERNWEECSLSFLPALAKAYGLKTYAPEIKLHEQS
ncbi:MAG: helix-turn-helix transcriptional regulator [Planctomycetota bacterium]